MRLTDNVAIITGASQGLGLGIARRLAREGARLVICARSADRGQAALQELLGLGAEARFLAVDLADPVSTSALVQFTLGEFGRIDILVNNAQTMKPWVPSASEEVDEHLRVMMATGLGASLRLMREVMPSMRSRHWGRIVNVGSLNARQGAKYSLAYNVTKAAIEALTRTAAAEWGRFGISVNTILPAGMSPATEAYIAANPNMANFPHFPMKRTGDPEQDIGGAVLGLVSAHTGYITGQSIFVDGGVFLRMMRQSHEMFAPQS